MIGNSPKNKYIQKAVLNGKPYTKSYLRHAAIVAGGMLTLYMGDQPSATWGVIEADRPKSGGAE
ncbi:glycoside hydrolase domain-containing protein [Pedobacter sp. NJ-S-72]